MSKQPGLNERQIVAGFGRQLGFLIDGLNISQSAKDLLLEIVAKMDPPAVVEFAAVLQEKLATEQSSMLEIDLQNKLDAIAIKNANETAKVDQDSLVEIKKLIKDKELSDLRQTIK